MANLQGQSTVLTSRTRAYNILCAPVNALAVRPTSASILIRKEMDVLPVALASEHARNAALGVPAAVSLVNDSDDEDEELGFDAAGEMNEAVPRDSTELVSLPNGKPVTDHVRASWIRGKVCSLWGQARLLQTCPGPNPVCLESAHLQYLQEAELEYVVAEKTDGVRYLLLLCRPEDIRESSNVSRPSVPPSRTTHQPHSGHVAFMIDRAFDAYEVVVCNIPDGMYKGTLLDGELVKEHSGELKYLVYDAVAVYGLHVGNVENYITRMNLLSDVLPVDALPVSSPPSVIASVGEHARCSARRVGVSVAPVDGVHAGFSLFRKPLFHPRHAAHVMRMAGVHVDTTDVEAWAAAGVDVASLQRLGSFSHKSDGVILTPLNMAIITGTHWHALKWKQQHPLDLLLEASIGDNSQEWSDYANPVLAAKRRAKCTIRSILADIQSQSSTSENKQGKKEDVCSSGGRDGADCGVGHGFVDSVQHLPNGGNAVRRSRWSMSSADVKELQHKAAADGARAALGSSSADRKGMCADGDAVRATSRRSSGAGSVDLGKGLVAQAFNFRMTGAPSKAAPCADGNKREGLPSMAERRGGSRSERTPSPKRSRVRTACHEVQGREVCDKSGSSKSSKRPEVRSPRGRRVGDGYGCEGHGSAGGESCGSDEDDGNAERRAAARRDRSERKSQALKQALAQQEEAKRIKKRAELRLKMLERAYAEDGRSTQEATDTYGLRSLQDDIMEQPASIHWKLRLLYRVGRTFEDAAVAFNYSGYRLRFVLQDSAMLRSVLCGIESLMREQYLHVRRARLKQHHIARHGQVPAADVPSVRAVSVVVECDSCLDLPKQVMVCKVMRARQDKLDPNCYLTITRTLNVMQDPVNALDLVRALQRAHLKYKLV